MSKPEPVTQAEFARRCGVYPGSIQHDREQGRIKVLPDGKIDAAHPLSVATMQKHLAKHGQGEFVKRTNTPHRAAMSDGNMLRGPDDGLAPGEQVTDFRGYTIQQIAHRFGSQLQFIDVLNSVKKIAEIEEKEIRNAAAKGKLVDRELVKSAVIGPMESAIPQILTDGAKQIAQRISTMTKAGAEGLELEREAESILRSFLKPMRDKMVKGLK